MKERCSSFLRAGYIVWIMLCLRLPCQAKKTHVERDREPEFYGGSHLVLPALHHRSLFSSGFCSRLLMVTAFDGSLSAVNPLTGEKLWSMQSKYGALVTSTLGSIKSWSGKSQITIVPSLDGSLYKLENGTLERLILDEKMTEAAWIAPDGTFLIMTKESVSYGTDPYTGKVYYYCDGVGCQLNGAPAASTNRDILLVKNNRQNIRAVDATTGVERWNLSLVSYDVQLVSASRQSGHCQVERQQEGVSTAHARPGEDYVWSLPRPDEPDSIQWLLDLDAPIVSMWRIENGIVSRMDPFLHMSSLLSPPETGHELLYLGAFDGQSYIHPLYPAIDPLTLGQLSHSRNVVTRLGVRPVQQMEDNQGTILKTFPNKLIAGQEDTTPVEDTRGVAVVLNYLTQLIANGSSKKPRGSFRSPDVCFSDATPTVPSFWLEWWKTIIVFSVLVSVLLSALIFSAILYLWNNCKKKLVTVDTNEPGRTPSSSSRSNEGSLTHQTLSMTSVCETGFTSRYQSDFEHLECIGRGGFGMVFKAKNHMDDCLYAVKRIQIADCKEAREKVMREVKALAKLDHRGIVRYFNAWWESPPSDWQRDTDRSLLGLSTSRESSSRFVGPQNIHSHSVFTDTATESRNHLCISAVSRTDSYILQKEASPDSSIVFTARPSYRSGFAEESSVSDSIVFEESANVQSRPMRYLTRNQSSGSTGGNSDEGVDVESSNPESFAAESCFRNGHHQVSSESESEDNDQDVLPSQRCNVESEAALRANSDDGILFTADLPTTELSCSHRTKPALTYFPARILSSEPCLKTYNGTVASNGVCRPYSAVTAMRRIQSFGCICNRGHCSGKPPVFLYIQMQLCAQGTLREWLVQQTPERNLEESWHIFSQILDAVSYCHDHGLIHRDIKPSNIFFSLDGLVKVGDFGLVAEEFDFRDCEESEKDGGDHHTGQVGTGLYMSPEQVAGRPYDLKVDIYALGLVLLELLIPFSTQMERLSVLTAAKRQSLSEAVKRKLADQMDLVEWMLASDPARRPTCQELLTHPSIHLKTRHAHPT